MQYLLGMVDKIGVPGLILTMALEGLSLPFPGIVIILTLGYILNLSTLDLFIVAGLMSLTYSIASYIPYHIGMKLEKAIRMKYDKQLQKVQHYFNKYGNYSIALFRPFAIGNYISYFAGMSGIKLWKYFLLTFTGIFPWSLVMLLIGRFTKGNVNTGLQLIQSYSGYICAFAVLILLAYICRVLLARSFSQS